MSRRFWSRLWWNLARPEYVFRPAQLLWRLRARISTPREYETVRLPWGVDLQIRPSELVSGAIWRKGVYDVVMSETVWRLLDDGDVAVDIGAHVGYVASLMAVRVGRRGKVFAFEPHPVLSQELRGNSARWTNAGDTGAVVVHELALSDRNGSGFLQIPADWERNRGGASVAAFERASLVEGSILCPCRFGRLDEVLAGEECIGLAKIDVEGHEEAVLRGGGRLLSQRAIRDIVFEDHGRYPTPTMRLLEGFGYTLFSLARKLLGPALAHPSRASVAPWNDRNYLATRDPARAAGRLQARGWAVLRTQ